MVKSAREILSDYLTAQATGDIDEVMGLVSDDAVFDVGRGHYAGEEVRVFHERLRDIHSQTTVAEIHTYEQDPSKVTALLDQTDDDLKPLGIDRIQLDVEVHTNEAGRIALFTARPTPASLAMIMTAHSSGRTSEGVELAEKAGNLPPSTPEGKA